MSFVDVDDYLLDGFENIARRFVLTQHDARAADSQLEPFPAHGLDQDAELQLAAAGDLKGVGLSGRGRDTQGNVAFRFSQKSLANHAALHLVTLLSGERTIVDTKGHGEGRRIDGLCGNWLREQRIGDCVGDGGADEAGNGDDVASERLIDRLTLEAPEGENFRDASVFDERTIAQKSLDHLIWPERA